MATGKTSQGSSMRLPRKLCCHVATLQRVLWELSGNAWNVPWLCVAKTITQGAWRAETLAEMGDVIGRTVSLKLIVLLLFGRHTAVAWHELRFDMLHKPRAALRLSYSAQDSASRTRSRRL